MFTLKTIRDDYFNPIFSLYPYGRDKICQIIQSEGLTENNRHDLWKCMLDSAEYNIPYLALNKLDARILYFLTDLHYVIFQRRILKLALKELGIARNCIPQTK